VTPEIPVYAGWPVPALLLFAAAWLTILGLLAVGIVRSIILGRDWRRRTLPPWGTPELGRRFNAIAWPFGVIAVLCFLAAALGDRYTP
jgi:hypothetical protein